MNKSIKYLLMCICVMFCVYLCVCFENVQSSVKHSLDIAVNILMPSLFPFFVISDILVKILSQSRGVVAGIFAKVFRLPEVSFGAYLCGIISGYPVGAAAVYALYEDRQITKPVAERLLYAANNCGPLFLICAVGCGILGSLKTGVVLYIIHITSGLITIATGSVFAKNQKYISEKKTATQMPDIASSVEKGFFQCIKVTGFVVFFAIVTDMIIFSAKKFSINTNTLPMALLISIIEMTNGVRIACEHFDIPTAMKIISFACGFSGSGVIMQTALVTKNILSLKKYISYKLLNGLIAYCLTDIYNLLFSDNVLSVGESINTYIIRITLTGVCFILFFAYIMSYNKKHIKKHCNKQ